MAIFHSYVCLPEGTQYPNIPKKIDWPRRLPFPAPVVRGCPVSSLCKTSVFAPWVSANVTVAAVAFEGLTGWAFQGLTQWEKIGKQGGSPTKLWFSGQWRVEQPKWMDWNDLTFNDVWNSSNIMNIRIVRICSHWLWHENCVDLTYLTGFADGTCLSAYMNFFHLVDLRLANKQSSSPNPGMFRKC